MLESEIDALAKEVEEYKTFKSIPGIGESGKFTATQNRITKRF